MKEGPNAEPKMGKMLEEGLVKETQKKARHQAKKKKRTDEQEPGQKIMKVQCKFLGEIKIVKDEPKKPTDGQPGGLKKTAAKGAL